ncbi:MAG TPA: hypothetical protein VFX96_08575 [Pyrinomonadaceae bacterium]|nr:hypothetical protein [Pyrinomonadaceae bacterium]
MTPNMLLMLFAQEQNNPWESAPANPAPQVLSLFEDNPFGRFAEMFFEQTLEWEPYARPKLLDYLAADPKAGVEARGHDPAYFQGSLARHPTANGVTFRLNPGHVSSPEALARALEYLGRWQSALPRFTRASATADLRPSEFFLNRGIEFLPECFGSHVAWYTLIAPRAYAPFFDAEDLRGVPAHRVEERDDGSFALTAYPDPFDFEGAEATRRIKEVTDYLNARRKR